MVDPLIPEDPGLWSSIGDELNLPGFAIRNILMGNLEGAGRKVVYFGGNIIDSVLPGDWIDPISRKEDKPEFSDVIGGMDEGPEKFITNLVGNTLTDPLSLIPGAWVAKGLGKAGKAIGAGITAADKVLPGTAAKLANLKLKTKSTFGWLDPQSPEAQAAIRSGKNAGTLANQAAMASAKTTMTGWDPGMSKTLFDVIHNNRVGAGGKLEELLPDSEVINTPQRLGAQLAGQTSREPVTGQLLDPVEDYLQVKKPGEIQPIDPLSKSLGVQGVADDPIASAAADATREHFPIEATDPRFASGVDIANQQLLAPGRGMKGIQTYAPEAEDVARTPSEFRTVKDPLTGAVQNIPIEPRITSLLPDSPIEALNATMGGSAAPMSSVAAGAAPRATKPMIKLDEQLAQWHRRADALGKSPEETALIKSRLSDYLDYIHGDFLSKTKDYRGLTIHPGDDPLTMIPQDYAKRIISGVQDESDIAMAGANSNSLKGRVLKENQTFRQFMNEHPEMTVENDLMKATTALAGEAGRAANRAKIAESLLGDKFTALNDSATAPAVLARIAEIKKTDPDGAYLLENQWNGLGERSGGMELLHKANTIFKPSAVFGVGIPRIGGINKNIAAFPMQWAAEGEWKQAWKQLLATPGNMYEAARKLMAGYGVKLPSGVHGADADLIASALANSKGRAKNAIDALHAAQRPDLADALSNGVIDGFVGAEAAQNSIRQSGMAQRGMAKVGMGPAAIERASNVLDAPAESFQGAEQYARLRGFKDIRQQLIDGGMDPVQASEQAADRGRSALYDYTVMTPENRAFRDIVPFGAFQTNAIRQSAKFLTKNPIAAVAASNVIGQQGDNPIYPSMQGKTNIPIGMDENGNQTYLTSLGLPIEALGNIPNPSANMADLGRQIEQDVIGSSHPLIKSALGAVFNVDPYFGTPYGQYDKIAGQSAGSVGKAYNKLAGTGLIQPLSGPIGMIGKLLDDRGSIGSDLLDLGTGVNTVSVDEDRALRQQLDAALQRNPDVKKFTGLYQEGDDPETKALLAELEAAKGRIKAKRKAAKATEANPQP